MSLRYFTMRRMLSLSELTVDEFLTWMKSGGEKTDDAMRIIDYWVKKYRGVHSV